MSNMSALVRVLRDASCIQEWGMKEWDLLMCQSLPSALSGYLAELFDRQGLNASVPEPPGRHLDSAKIRSARQAEVVRWELIQIHSAFQKKGLPVIVLKGAAYQGAGMDVGRGRIFNDIDLLVARKDIETAERALMQVGWYATHHDAYDQKYYRTWMHEIPPLRHVKRATVVDVHHAILPLTAPSHPDTEKLINSAVDMPGMPGVKVLCPLDMVLHSACHLFHEGEFDHGLRDLVDLQGLLHTFSNEPGFWQALPARATELELEMPLRHTLRYVEKILGVEIPSTVLNALPGGFANSVRQVWMDRLFKRVLCPRHGSCDDLFSGVARWLLYIRGHHLRMPMRLLVPHLIHKALAKPDDKPKAETDTQ